MLSGFRRAWGFKFRAFFDANKKCTVYSPRTKMLFSVKKKKLSQFERVILVLFTLVNLNFNSVFTNESFESLILIHIQ